MATLADIQTRITTETNRDDLADTLATSLTTILQSSIDYYAAERFWFNETIATAPCVIGDQYLTIPTGLRVLDKLFLIVGGIRYPMTKRELVDIETLYSTPISGQPTDYAFYQTSIRVWPTPNVAYSTIWLGVADVTPAIDYAVTTSTNAWLVQGYDLITARAKIILYRDYLSALVTDPRLSLAMVQEKVAYDRLKAETNRRLSTGRMRASW
jgi:hypothetical protein